MGVDKAINDNQLWVNSWYWRTNEQREIDYIEESEGRMTAYAFKWNPAQNVKLPLAYQKAYPKATYTTIHRDHFDEFLL